MCVHTSRIRYASRAPGIYYIIYHIHRPSRRSGFFVRAVARETGEVGPTCGLLRLNCRPRVDDLRRGTTESLSAFWKRFADGESERTPFGRARIFGPPSSLSLPSGTGLDFDSHCLTLLLIPDSSLNGNDSLRQKSRAVAYTLLRLATSGR